MYDVAADTKHHERVHLLTDPNQEVLRASSTADPVSKAIVFTRCCVFRLVLTRKQRRMLIICFHIHLEISYLGLCAFACMFPPGSS